MTGVGSRMGGILWPQVLVEGRGSLVNVEGFLDLSRESLHQDLGVIQCVMMTGG